VIYIIRITATVMTVHLLTEFVSIVSLLFDWLPFYNVCCY